MVYEAPLLRVNDEVVCTVRCGDQPPTKFHTRQSHALVMIFVHGERCAGSSRQEVDLKPVELWKASKCRYRSQSVDVDRKC